MLRVLNMLRVLIARYEQCYDVEDDTAAYVAGVSHGDEVTRSLTTGYDEDEDTAPKYNRPQDVRHSSNHVF
jgi:hypothetical protein